MEPQRLRAARSDGGVLAVPSLEEASERLLVNRDWLASWDYDVQGRSASRLRAMARREIIEASRTYLDRFGLEAPETPEPSAPWVATGHQPEVFHAGVWIKNFAVSALARQVGGVPLNLVVDNDTPKMSSVRVPTLREGKLETQAVDFDDWIQEIPYEDWTIANPEKFASFGHRARDLLGDLVADPILDEFWPEAVEAGERTNRIGLRLASARSQLERRWGVSNWEVPLSAVCETEAFAWFASHLLAHLPRFRQVYNESLIQYRKLYGIRSRNHPVPELHDEGNGWLEAPFWVWRADEPRRRPLLARQGSRILELRIDGESETIAELPLGPDQEACCAAEMIRNLPSRKIRLRTRALTTTLFARLLLSDLFIHGIGGAKYDELGDEILRGFFGIRPPGFFTLSMTLWLGLPESSARPEALRKVEHELRDLTFNPDRHLEEPISEAQRAWVVAKHQAIAGSQETRADRVARYYAIRRCNEALAEAVEPLRPPLQAERKRLRAGLHWNQIARNREYALVLHSQERLQKAFRRVVPSAFAG